MITARHFIQRDITDNESCRQSPNGEKKPWLLATLCILIPLLPSSSVFPGPLKSHGSPARMVAITLFSLSVLGFLMGRRTVRRVAVRPGTLILFLYFTLVLAVYGVGATHVESVSIEANKTRLFIVILLAYVGVGIYSVTKVSSHRQKTFVLGFLLAGLTFNCVVGILQNLKVIDLHLLFQPPGFVVNTGDQGRGPGAGAFSERLGATRASATSGHPIEFSVLAAVTVPLALHFSRYAASKRTKHLAAVASVLALFAVPAGISRSGVVALAAALLFYMWSKSVRSIGVALLMGFLAIIAQFAFVPNTANALWITITNSSDDASVLERIDAYAKVSQTFQDHPWFGLGLGGALPSEYGFLDNEWLQALVQGGIVGLSAISILTIGGFFGVAAALRTAGNKSSRDQSYAIGAMWIGILASSFTFDLFAFQQASLIFFILFGLLWSGIAIPVSHSVATDPRGTGLKQHLKNSTTGFVPLPRH